MSAILLAAMLVTGCQGIGQNFNPSCADLVSGHAVHPAAVSPNSHHAAHAGLVQPGLAPSATATPDPSPPPPSPSRVWSNAAGWPGGNLPLEGATVEIPEGEVVLLDVSPPRLGGLRIEGALVFAEQDLELQTDYIRLDGGLYIGSAQQGFQHQATITLTGERKNDAGCFGHKSIGILNGTLELYGDAAGPSWTRLTQTAPKGATSITVEDASGWQVGDRIAIASTDYFAYAGADGEVYDRQIEERVITAVNGNQLSFGGGFEYMHFGETQQFGTGTPYANNLLDSRAEVMRLNRNVVIRSEAETLAAGSDRYRFGGHIMAMGGSRVRLDSVELTRMGQLGVLLRYPIHFHLMGNGGQGSFIRNVSLHHLFNRCITIHGTNGVLVEGSAAYETFGHCYFLEDGAEFGNLLTGNLGMMARRPAEQVALLGSDRAHPGPAIFWITNPANDFVGNVAASSQGSGFWYGLPEHPTGPSYFVFDGASIFNRRIPLGLFDGNLAHSNAADGLHVDRGPTVDVKGVEVTYYRPRSDPNDAGSAPVVAVFDNFSAYRHRGNAVWTRGDNTVLRGALLVDNAIGATFASSSTSVQDSIMVGESANLGNPMSWEVNNGEVGVDGRSLPRPWHKEFAIRGFEFYDGDVWADGVHFENYTPNALRQASAVSVLDFTAFSLSARNRINDVSFGPLTNEVRFATRTAAQQQPGETDSNEDGYRSAVFQDLDGSLTGTAGVWVTVNNPFLAAFDCSLQTAWNAYVCGGRYVSLTLDNQGQQTQLAPVRLRRGTDPNAGPEHTMFGSPNGGPNTPNRHFRTLLALGAEYHYHLNAIAPSRTDLHLGELDPGDWLIVSLPFGGNTPILYRDWWIDERNRIASVASLAALRNHGDSAYYFDGTRLWIRLAQQDDRDWAHVSVCRVALCK